MIRPLQFFRLVQINLILMRYGLTRPVIGRRSTSLQLLSYLNPWSFKRHTVNRGESIRLALESLGPIFVKFGQALSTRRDLLPDDLADELEKLQDRVPPFSSELVREIVEKAYKKPIDQLFSQFDETPLASASVAQVHAAVLNDGTDVVVKVLRPNILRIIQNDVALMYLVARFVRRFWPQGRRLRPVELVAEFEQVIYDELDLLREAASASQLRRNFLDSPMLYVPKIYWDYARRNVMVMERIYGLRISDVKALKAKNTNMKKLAEHGVEIFFTQVLRDSFFHADMHPGNILVDVSDPENPKYNGVDFGVMGSLSPSDQRYLAENLYAFFNRDYRRIAVLHVESGWVPANTRIDQFEAAIRTVCEPIFEKPLKDISFGQLLLQLFRTAERFNMELQPQLMLLQKTLLNIEGLGRQLYPDLDLWQTAKPFLENWMREQKGVKRLLKQAVRDFPAAAEKIMKSPELLFNTFSSLYEQSQMRVASSQARSSRSTFGKVRGLLLGSGAALLFAAGVIHFHCPREWVIGGIGGGLLLASCLIRRP